jgi:alpha-tubulin suppressor-like RCC1 family protein
VVRSALAWGDNVVGQVGDGTAGGQQHLPVRPFGLGSGVSQVAAGHNFTLAVQSGTVLAWGQDSDGQLGDGTLDFQHDPVPVLAASGSVQMDGGWNHTIVVVERPVVIGP